MFNNIFYNEINFIHPKCNYTHNAYIMLTNSTTGLSYNYVLNSTNSNQLIPVDQLVQGTYIVNLVANGEIIDTKNLIIN